MAATDYPVNHPLAVKLFSRGILQEAIRETWIHRFIGTKKSSLVYLKSETNKQPGDKITYGLRMKLSGDGQQGDSTLEGNEEALVTHSDSLVINQLRHAVRSGGKMSEQRVPFSVRNEAKDALRDWYAERYDTAFFNQICGNTAQADTRYTGNNAITAYNANYKIMPDSKTLDESLSNTSTHKFSLSLIDKAKERARTIHDTVSGAPVIRPFKMGGKDYYVMFLHDFQVTDMRTNTDTGQWLDIQKAAMQGGNVGNNPIFTGALGVYNDVILHEANRVTQGINSVTGAAQADTRRAVLCGAQAACLAFGMDHGPMRMDWREELFDYGNQLGVAAACMWGLKRTRFNSLDFASIIVSTYASDSD